MRIPAWTDHASIRVNDIPWQGEVNNQIAIIRRTWKDGDRVVLTLPMELKTTQWDDFTRAIERGPLVYALKIRDVKKIKDRNDHYGPFQEVYALDDWNYALYEEDLQNISKTVKVVEKGWDGTYSWNLENAPVELKMRGIQLADWILIVMVL